MRTSMGPGHDAAGRAVAVVLSFAAAAAALAAGDGLRAARAAEAPPYDLTPYAFDGAAAAVADPARAGKCKPAADAWKKYAAAVPAGVRNVRVEFLAARCLAKLGLGDAAIPILETLPLAYPALAGEAWYLLGDQLLRARRYDEAASAFAEVAAPGRRYAPAQILAARAALSAGDPFVAMERLADPESRFFWTWERAGALDALADAEDALKAHDRAHALRWYVWERYPATDAADDVTARIAAGKLPWPSPTVVMSRLARLLDADDVERAEALVAALAARPGTVGPMKDPASAWADVGAGELLLEAKDYAGAAAKFDAAHAAAKGSSLKFRALCRHGKALARTDDLKEAREKYRTALAHWPDDPFAAQCRFDHGLLLDAHGLEPLARVEFAKAAELASARGDVRLRIESLWRAAWLSYRDGAHPAASAAASSGTPATGASAVPAAASTAGASAVSAAASASGAGAKPGPPPADPRASLEEALRGFEALAKESWPVPPALADYDEWQDHKLGFRIVERATYWAARALTRLGRAAEAADRFEWLARHFPLRYYAELALERLAEIDPARAAAVRDRDPVLAAAGAALDPVAARTLDPDHLPLARHPATDAAVELWRLGLRDDAESELRAGLNNGWLPLSGQVLLSVLYLARDDDYWRSHWVLKWKGDLDSYPYEAPARALALAAERLDRDAAPADAAPAAAAALAPPSRLTAARAASASAPAAAAAALAPPSRLTAVPVVAAFPAPFPVSAFAPAAAAPPAPPPFAAPDVPPDLAVRDLAWRLCYPRAYDAAVRGAATSLGVDPFLILAVMRNESGFRPEVVSVAHALGLMQVLYHTAFFTATKLLGMKALPFPKVFDPSINVRIGARYLKELL
ncbi:MAG TPA: transglycosylase SLT domain-containing protein, partial [Myxococcota bacterium]|nr:transglycosylase SLT domain-containing protein [Myxococcota bacterium]